MQKLIKWHIEKSKDDNDILVINDRYIHSKISPLKEAENIIYPGINLIVIFGAGLGYHIKNIIKNNKDSFFLIFEPLYEISDLSLKYLGSDILNNKKIIFLKDLIVDDILYFFTENNILPNIRIISYSNLGYKTLLPELELLYFKVVKESFETHVKNILTEDKFVPLWSKNFFYNSSLLSEKELILPVASDLKDNILVIVAAGPSCIEDIKTIKGVRDKVTVFSVDTAIKPMLELGVMPDAVISLDGQHFSLFDFMDVNRKDTNLVMDLIGYPEIAKQFDNFYFLLNSNLLCKTVISFFFEKIDIKVRGIATGGTVSDYALNFGIALGFNKIYFSGLDLSYPNLQTHAVATPFYNSSFRESTFFNTIETRTANEISKRELMLASSKINGDEVLTDFVLKNYGLYFERLSGLLKKNNISIFTNNAQGLKIEPIKEISLHSLIEASDSYRVEFNELLSSSIKIKVDKRILKDFYSFFLEDIFSYSKLIEGHLKDFDFLNDNKDNLEKISLFFNEVTERFPFLNRFSLMTEVILFKKGITKNNNVIWYKHMLHKILQSIYYLVRKVQKVLSII